MRLNRVHNIYPHDGSCLPGIPNSTKKYSNTYFQSVVYIEVNFCSSGARSKVLFSEAVPLLNQSSNIDTFLRYSGVCGEGGYANNFHRSTRCSCFHLASSETVLSFKNFRASFAALSRAASLVRKNTFSSSLILNSPCLRSFSLLYLPPVKFSMAFCQR